MNYTFQSSSWMKDNHSWLEDKCLKEICILGSHDAHMNERTLHFDIFSTLDNTLTQSVDVYQQLLLGVRYFDVRPAIAAFKGDTVQTHHSANSQIGLLGGLGRPMDSIVSDINKFTAENPHEIIILNISHVEHFDYLILGKCSERDFSREDWTKLAKCLMKLKRLASKSKTDANPIKVPLKRFWETGASVIIRMESPMPFDLLNDNIFKFDMYDKYSDTNNFGDMRNDQYKKLNEQKKIGAYFLLSWTLTQSTGNIRSGATVANGHLTDVLRKVDKQIFPNIIQIDNVLNDTPCCVCAKINYILHNPAQKNTLPPMLNITVERYSGKWANFYGTLVPFKINKEPFLFAATHESSGGKKWFVAKLNDRDGVNHELSNGKWQKYFETAVPFYHGNNAYMFAQSRTNNKWFVAKLDGAYAVETEIMTSTSWKRFFQSAVSFCYNDEYYLFAQSKDENKWFVSRLHPAADPGIEIINGNWHNFFETMVVFYIGKTPYLFAQTSSSKNKWFIAKLSTNKNDINTELANGHWNNFFGSAAVFNIDGIPFLYAQTAGSDNKWFISELSANGATLGNEIISGKWNSYYNKCCVYNYNGIPYLFAQSSSRRCFISPLISCL